MQTTRVKFQRMTVAYRDESLNEGRKEGGKEREVGRKELSQIQTIWKMVKGATTPVAPTIRQMDITDWVLVPC